MSSYTMKGKILTISQPVQKSEKFTLYEAVLQSEGEYPKPIIFNLNERVYNDLINIGEGGTVTLHFNIEGREHNGRHYVSLKAWKID